jgi:hypothetical protein
MSLKGDMKALVRQKKKEGWEIERTRNCHLRWIFIATGAVVISATTPSDYRSLLNTKADLKRCERAIEPRYNA